jgi:hypothetical protein
VCGNYTWRVKSHSAGGNCTLHVEITLVRVVAADLFFINMYVRMSKSKFVFMSFSKEPHLVYCLVTTFGHGRYNKLVTN